VDSPFSSGVKNKMALHFLQNQRYWFETFGLVNVFCQKADFGNQE